jgi:hypothetical protein
MKTRIILTALLIIGGAWFASSIGQPVATLADNKVAVATVNGGDAEYIGQSAVRNTTRLPWTAGAVLVGLTLVWYTPVRKALTSINTKSF